MASRILIADGAATNRIYLRAFLGESAASLLEAPDLARAERLARDHRPDLIILDEDLLAGGADAAPERLRRAVGRADMSILVLTRDFCAQTRLRLLLAGADEVLPKPLNESVARARLRNLLRARAVSRELAQRERTTMDLGFAEANSTWQGPRRLWVAAGPAALPAAFGAALGAIPDCRVLHLDPGTVMGRLESARARPDLVLLPARREALRASLDMVAELRARDAARHAAIILAHDPDQRAEAARALDIGANDLMEWDSTAEEMRLRLDLHLALKAKADKLRAMMERGARMAMVDPLTGLFNRRYALPHLDRIAQAAIREGRPWAVMALDLDRFKSINDGHGHPAGDAVLVEVARRLKENVRGVDLLARIGGEEFLVAMPDTDQDAAMAAAERLRRVTADRPITLPDGQSLTVTVSIGLAMAGHTENIGMTGGQDLIERADCALLAAKAHGRNQVERYCSAA